MKMVASSPIQYSERRDFLLRLPLLKRWAAVHQPYPYFENREELYEYIVSVVGEEMPICYLEFGVYEGASLLNWIELNIAEKSEFIGFDSFEGLPEHWIKPIGSMKRNAFSTEGKMPVINDNRVSFVKGWFQNTLPIFLDRFSPDKQIIIHCDADIYSSTMYVLCKMDSSIKQGTIIIFDEFSNMLHEFRAFDDYTSSFGRQYEVLGAAGHFYQQVAIRFTK
jgi:hypothetical protein